jgi:hypothetical protein
MMVGSTLGSMRQRFTVPHRVLPPAEAIRLTATTTPALAVCAHATIWLAALSRGQEIYAN